MKNVLTAAIVAALVAGATGAGAATLLNGKQIKAHSIPANRLTPSAIASFTKAEASPPRALAAAVNSTIDYETSTTPVVAGDTATAACPTGDVAISGGYQWTDGGGPVVSNIYLSDGSGWAVKIGDTTSSNDGQAVIEVYVSCEPS